MITMIFHKKTHLLTLVKQVPTFESNFIYGMYKVCGDKIVATARPIHFGVGIPGESEGDVCA